MRNRAYAILLALFVLLPQHSSAQEEQAAPTGTVKLEVGGLAGASGSIYVAVYDDESTWLSDEVFLSKEIDIQSSLDGEFVIGEIELPLGEYAISIFHDSNGNGELDTNFIGLPKEPVALSNNAKAKFGPPKYEDLSLIHI